MDSFCRLMELLASLQSAPLTGEQLAAQLGVTLRTLRRDINRLRDAGFAIEATPGVYGGYRLAPGNRLPPLVLTDDEAVAIAIALGGNAAATVTGLADSALHDVLTKLEQLLPSRLRVRVADFRETTVSMLRTPAEPADAGQLALLARACRASARTRLTYSARQGRTREWEVEPYRLVQTSHCWYLAARDSADGDWKTFRVDRIVHAELTNAQFALTDPPDVRRLVTEGMAVAPYSFQARLRVPVSADDALQYVPRSYGVVDPIDAQSSELTIGYEHQRWLVHFIADLPWDVEVIDPPDLQDAIVELGRRLVATRTRNS